MRDDIPTLILSIDEGDQRHSKTAQLMVDSFKELGIDAEIEAMLFIPRLGIAQNLETAPHMFICYWWPTMMDPWDYLGLLYHTPSDYGVVFELARYENPVFDQLIDEAQLLSATDKDAALENFIEAQNILAEDAAAIFLFDLTLIVGQRAAIKGYVDNPLYGASAIFFKDIYREGEDEEDGGVIPGFGGAETLSAIVVIVGLGWRKKRREGIDQVRTM